MTDLSKEILTSWQIRKTKAQKTAFIEFLKEKVGPENVRIEEGGFPRSRNIILGNVDTARFILGAHYDTQPVLPFPNFLTPKNIPAYIGFICLLMIPFFLLGVAVGVLSAFLPIPVEAAMGVSYALIFVLLALMLVGPANKHTANDNTSGVIAVLEAYADPVIREQAAFVLFDNEEMGLFGSGYFFKTHKSLMKGKLLLNLDCVGDGDTLMVIRSKAAKKRHAEALGRAFLSTEGKTVLITDAATTLYPSDQQHFPVSVGIAAFHRMPVIGYYLSRIHTKRDTVCEEANIALITHCLHRLAEGSDG